MVSGEVALRLYVLMAEQGSWESPPVPHPVKGGRYNGPVSYGLRIPEPVLALVGPWGGGKGREIWRKRVLE